MVFLLTGLSLETSHILAQLKNVKVLVAALFSSLIFFPLIAYYTGRFFFADWPDFTIGTLIIGVVPVTLASGTLMTAIALGNVPLSLFICVLVNFCSIVTIPFMINLILQYSDLSIQLPVLKILIGLTLKVLIPTLIGLFLHPWLKDKIRPYEPAISIFNQGTVLLIIFNAVSSSTDRILQVGPTLLLVFGFMIALHLFFLAANKLLAGLIRLDEPSTAAFTIHTSQKTLTISYLIWAGHFAAAYPMALIPAIAYHLTQMILGTLAARWFRAKAERTKIKANRVMI
jgi:sodium/bile acid cotransporter 7